MSHFAPLPTPSLPETTRKIIEDFIEASRLAFGKDLQSAILYGSAAEGKLQPTSDTNLILVLNVFEGKQAEQIRPALRVAHTAIRLNVMFLLRDEIPAAVQSFASKFADILRRRVILHGEDPFAMVTIPSELQIRQLRQQLLNLMLRMRSAYAERGLREEQLAIFLSSTAGTLRGLAQVFLEVQGKTADSPRAALEALGATFNLQGWSEALLSLGKFQQGQLDKPGSSPRVFLQVLQCVQLMREKSESFGGGLGDESI